MTAILTKSISTKVTTASLDGWTPKPWVATMFISSSIPTPRELSLTLLAHPIGGEMNTKNAKMKSESLDTTDKST